jgi:hypothetical protein
MPDINCRTLPVLNKLDQDPREEIEGDSAGAETVGKERVQVVGM